METVLYTGLAIVLFLAWTFALYRFSKWYDGWSSPK